MREKIYRYINDDATWRRVVQFISVPSPPPTHSLQRIAAQGEKVNSGAQRQVAVRPHSAVMPLCLLIFPRAQKRTKKIRQVADGVYCDI